MKKIILSLSIALLVISCEDLSSLNNDDKNPSVVPAATLFTNAEKSLTDQMTNTNVNRNIFRLATQQWTETTYTDESNYDWSTRKISDNHWNALYAGTLADLKTARDYVSAEVIPANDLDFVAKTAIKNNKIAQIDILMVYTYQILVDTFGDIPYTEALLGSSNYSPKYDSAISIYKALLVKLDTAIANIDVTNSGFEESDLLYNSGGIGKWVKFANSIKLKIATNLLASNLDNTTATNAINSAISGGLIALNSDNCKLPYMTTLPNTNQLYVDLVNSGRHDFVVTKPMVNKLIALNDPRRLMYTNGGTLGGTVGSAASYGTPNRTHISDMIQAPDFSGTLLDYSEVEFLLAELAERGVAAAGTAQTHYENAIKASMQDWGVSPADAATYLAQSTVAYSTATGTWKQKIGEQAWLALYNRGFEAWTSYRRLDFPILTAPVNATADALGKVPVRMKYPSREQTLNGPNNTAAAAAIGGDLLTTKLFWDIY